MLKKLLMLCQGVAILSLISFLAYMGYEYVAWWRKDTLEAAKQTAVLILVIMSTVGAISLLIGKDGGYGQ